MIKSEQRIKREEEARKKESALQRIKKEDTKDLEQAWGGFYDVDLRAEDANLAGVWRTWAYNRGYTPEMVDGELEERSYRELAK